MATTQDNTVPIPSPPGLPVVGNISDIDAGFPLGSHLNLAEKYGEIYRLRLPGQSSIYISSYALVNECCDETRFRKTVSKSLNEVRNSVHDGLFTARPEKEPNWGIAHRILMPAFGPLSIKGMFDEMHDIASQLAMKWARHGPETPIMTTDDFTRLTLDTIALCSMGYRFNSYYHDELHPFVQAMGDFLTESGARATRPGFLSVFYRQADQKYQEDTEQLRKTAHEVLKARKENPTDKKDLLNAMLNGRDPKTGAKMSDDNIIDNLITFLIAGHETTSGLLSFAFHNILRHPEAYRKAQQEVDEVVGTGPILVDHMAKLHYISAILRETLRLTATIPVIALEAINDEVIGGKYFIPKGETVRLLLAKSQVDPTVYGEDAKSFIPERMLDENFERLNNEFPNCWKPFGNGMRACIGRPFAWQEAVLVMAMLLQNFNFRMDDTGYQLRFKQTLTIKPKDFYMRATLRAGLTPTTLEHRLSGKTSAPDDTASPVSGIASGLDKATPSRKGKPLSIFYGSNSGTCESLAQSMASNAVRHGYSAVAVDYLDAANQNLPTDHPVVIITASYEGQPPDNAALFCSWLQSLKGKEMEKVSYAVFGCGHHDWAQTFHRVPKLVDSTIEKLGGTRIAPIGLADAAEGRMFSDFETWEDDVLWPAMARQFGTSEPGEFDGVQAGVSVEVTTPRSSTLRQDVKEAVVVEARDLVALGVPPKKHMEVQLPSNLRYTAGDYLAVLPLNPQENVRRAMRRFQLPWDAHITISSIARTTLPTNVSIPVDDVLGAYVELAQPATKRSILALVEATNENEIKEKLRALASDDYNVEIAAKQASLLDLLERFTSIELPFGAFLSLLPPMRVRQYSISSSPLWNASHATLTYSVLNAPARSGSGQHVGVASSYLASLGPGDKLHVAIRPSHAAFHLPTNAENTPVIMIAAGSGLAPFRGFVQERAAQIGAGRALAPALLFFGCRDPAADDLYRADLDRWEAQGAVGVRRAYSRRAEASEGCVHVQDRLWQDRRDVAELWDRGAKVYVCGSRSVGESVKGAIVKIYIWAAEEKGGSLSEEDAVKVFESVRNERYATDVFD